MLPPSFRHPRCPVAPIVRVLSSHCPRGLVDYSPPLSCPLCLIVLVRLNFVVAAVVVIPVVVAVPVVVVILSPSPVSLSLSSKSLSFSSAPTIHPTSSGSSAWEWVLGACRHCGGGNGPLAPDPPCKQGLAVAGGGCWGAVLSTSSPCAWRCTRAAPTSRCS
jgi:hypothetical protein